MSARGGRPGALLGSFLAAVGTARLIIVAFVVVLVIGAAGWDVDLGQLGSQSLWRIGMNLILALSLLPMIRGGTGLNFGLPLGVVAGLLGVVVVLNAGGAGWTGFLAATGLAIVFAVPIGVLYGMILNAVRGNEMVVGIYLGFAVVSLFSLVWAVAPFHNPTLIWPLGGVGLRQTLMMDHSFGGVLDGALAPIEETLLGGFQARLGLFLAAGVAFVATGFLFRTQLGLRIHAAGENPRFAAASGIRVNRTRVYAVTLSTVLAAVGIVVYSQSYGFAQLYAAPVMMALPAIAAVLIGGASVRHATLLHVFVGVMLFQTILTLAPPVLTAVAKGGDITESIRLTIQNGMILYALTRMGRKR